MWNFIIKRLRVLLVYVNGCVAGENAMSCNLHRFCFSLKESQVCYDRERKTDTWDGNFFRHRHRNKQQSYRACVKTPISPKRRVVSVRVLVRFEAKCFGHVWEFFEIFATSTPPRGM